MKLPTHHNHLLVTRLTTALAALLLALPAATTFAQRAQHKSREGGQHRGVPTPFPFLDKVIKFPVARLPKSHFIEMGATWNVLPKGYAGKVKAEQQVLLLSYGFKKGGIVRIFETKSAPGITPEKLAAQINEGGFFPNVARGDWKLKGVELNGVFVACGSQTPEALALAMQDLKAK